MGSKPKAPKAPPDPAIAAEKARREAIAIGQANARRTTKFGSASTVKSLEGPYGDQPSRPTEAIAEVALDTTAAGRKEKEAKAAESLRPGKDGIFTTGGDEGEGKKVSLGGFLKKIGNKKAAQLRASISPADRAALEQVKKGNAITRYINASRSRTGVASTKGGKK